MDLRTIPGLAEAIEWNTDLEDALIHYEVISKEDLEALKVACRFSSLLRRAWLKCYPEQASKLAIHLCFLIACSYSIFDGAGIGGRKFANLNTTNL